MSKQKERKLISIKDAVELTRYAPQTFYNMIYKDELKTFGRKGRGKKVLLDREEVLTKLGISLDDKESA
jgi:hypothetical protein